MQSPDPEDWPLGGFLLSTAVVAIAEIGDKTQLLAFLLAARFRAPLPVLLGILLATVANHALAAVAGATLAAWLQSGALTWALGLSFLVMALWALKPDRLEGEELPERRQWGAFLTTLVAFFFVEIGDKTQIATMALAVHFQNLLAVTAGSTLGMMLANLPAVLLGERAAGRLPLKVIRGGAACLFALMGAAVLLEAAGLWQAETPRLATLLLP